MSKLHNGRIATVVGARPQLIKAGPVTSAIRQMRGIDEYIIHTGQHYDFELSGQFLHEFALGEPWKNLGVGSGTHAAQVARMLTGLESALTEIKPAIVLTYGDTNSTLAGVLAATMQNVPVAHVEAGVRSWNRTMPEETNRLVADRLSSLLFCPSSRAVENLGAEGIESGIHQVGDVMLDVWQAIDTPLAGELLGRLRLTAGEYALVTVHRPENTDDLTRLTAILRALHRISDAGMRVVFPVHPRTRRAMEDSDNWPLRSIEALGPLSYLEMKSLIQSARVLLTDSGGLQKEALWAGVPCVTLRGETEWTETVDHGWNILVGASEDAIVSAAFSHAPLGTPPPVYGDGRAGAAIATVLEGWLGRH